MENKLQYIEYLLGAIEEANPFNIMQEVCVIEAKKKGEEILKKLVDGNYDISKININFEEIHKNFHLEEQHSYKEWKIRTRKGKIYKILKDK